MQIMKICHVFTLTVDIKNPLCEFEDIYWQIFLPEFHENLTLPGGVDSILRARSQKNYKFNQLPPLALDSDETLEGKSTCECLQIHARDS